MDFPSSLAYTLPVLILILAFLATRCRKPRKKPHGKRTSPPAQPPARLDYANLPPASSFPYRLRPSLLSPREYRFFCLLSAACQDKGLRVYPKVRMGDVCWVPEDLKDGKDGEKFWYWFSPIAKKHIDFVLADGKGAFVCGIEVDDASHDSPYAKGVDSFKDRMFLSAGLPLIRFRHGFSEESVKQAVSHALEKHRGPAAS